MQTKYLTKEGLRTTTLNSPPKPMGGRKRIAFTCNRGLGLHLFRREVILELLQAGYEVYIITPFDSNVESFIAAGASFIDYKLNTQSKKISTEFKSIIKLKKIYRKINPDIIFQYTIKPNIYGTIAATQLNVPCISIVPGLGVFPDLKNGIFKRMIEWGYSFASKNSKEIWFLNSHDQGFFDAKGWLKESTSRLLPGEGLNTSIFKYSLIPKNTSPQVLFLGRLLISKGVQTFAKVAQLCKSAGLDIDFHAVGYIDEDHPEGISSEELQSWVQAGYLTYSGTTSQPAVELAKADLIVVPTKFREGLNRVIQEALSIGRPVITTPVPGAGEIIQHNETGYLVPPNDPQGIVEVLIHHFEKSHDKREQMGKLGARRIREKYDVQNVLPHYWDAISRHCITLN